MIKEQETGHVDELLGKDKNFCCGWGFEKNIVRIKVHKFEFF